MIPRIPISAKFAPLIAPARYKGAHGGRASGKSHNFADMMVAYCLKEPGESANEGLRAVCLREIQKDLKESAKALIEQKLRTHGLSSGHGFRTYTDSIATPGDGIIIFKGMQDYTADSIKSLENFKVGWWEEAHTATTNSLALYRPTLRATGSERWFSWNPRRPSDPIETLLRGPELPTGSVVVEVNWRDNAFRNAEQEQERLDCLRMTPDQYPHIYEGAYATVLAGAYWVKDIVLARSQNRIGRVGPDPLMAYHAFCDLGGTGAQSDAFSMWIMQFIGREIRVLNYYEAVGQPLGTHVKWLRDNGYAGINVWLPHDGNTNDRIYDVSFKSAFEAAGFPVEVVPNQGRAAAKTRIEAARRVFPLMYFNEPTTSPGLDALGWYHEKRDEHRSIGLGPEHDWSSHAADAFGLGAVVWEAIRPMTKAPPEKLGWRDRLHAKAGLHTALGT